MHIVLMHMLKLFSFHNLTKIIIHCLCNIHS